jgi:hypothetical protein
MKNNDTKEDWLFIANQIKDRKSQGRESEVRIRGALIPMSKVRKEMSRYEYLAVPYRRPLPSKCICHGLESTTIRLKGLLDQNSLIVEAVAGSLLNPAARYRDLFDTRFSDGTRS